MTTKYAYYTSDGTISTYPTTSLLQVAAPYETVAGTSGNKGTANIANQGTTGVIRLSGNTTGEVHDLTGPRLELPLPVAFDANKSLRVTCKVYNKSAGASGNLYGILYLRDGASGGTGMSRANGVIFMSNTDDAAADMWVNGVASAPTNFAPIGARPRLFVSELGTIYMGGIKGNGLFVSIKSETLAYVPTYVGIGICSDVASNGSIDVSELKIEQV